MTFNPPLPAAFRADTAATSRWLSIVGIGEDGAEALSPVARGLVGDAEIVFGGRRHLGLAAPLIRGTAKAWPSPFDGAVSEVLRHRGQLVCVLASGDPFCYGVGATLARYIDAREMIVVPAPSAFSLSAARLGWSLPQAVLLSLHGRNLDLIRPHLQPGARIIALTSDGDGPAALARLLTQNGFGASRLTILEALGGPCERVQTTTAAGYHFATVEALNTVAIEVEAAPNARVLPRAPGLADDLFEHDGQITKRDVRALTLSALEPRRGQLLWDIGAGSGSVAIEWMLIDPLMRAIAIEQREDRAARIRRNAAAFGVPGLEVAEGMAPTALTTLAPPDAIFIGGGASDTSTFGVAARALRPGGRLVANAVTLETEALLIERRAAFGGELVRIAISRAEPLGEKTGWRPAMPITQWRWTKP
ncbi:MAG TPA: precorrin-6y C5,15-methyltransferase (decarboxylating) subunit CbiE [Xanthobacteraceae bacterium]|jgi:precorrin-6Y C5,15-methyltransferase (decarboxylating)|nr:precorrin-6y C5,15-methyltransferase (decarboxylating) subunit CbiE [Xanthobacteraceae bacterium]